MSNPWSRWDLRYKNTSHSCQCTTKQDLMLNQVKINDHCFCHTRCLLYYIPLTFHCTWTEKVALLSFATKHSPLLSALDSDTAVFFLTQKSPYLLHVFFDIYSVTKSICPFSTTTYSPPPHRNRVFRVLESPWIIMNRFGLLVGGGGATVTKASTSLYNLHTGYSGATLQFILKQARLTRRSIWRLITEGETRKIECHQVKSKAHLLPPKKIKMVSGGGAKTWLGVWSLTWERYQWPSWQSCTKGPGSILWKSPKEIKEAAALEPQGPHWKWTNSQLTSCSECTITSTQSRLWGFLKVLQLGFHSHY